MDLAWITVSDIQKAKKFFVEYLGLKLVSETPEHNWMELIGHDGGAELGVCQTNDESHSEKPGHNAIMTMTVADVAKTRQELENKGVTFYGPNMEVPGHVIMALFSDADGNKFQIVQMLDNK